ncbi:MAG: alanine-zipper protein, partial [Desulfurococcales archaeon]|nr:alanine-zipper protein [Desulfurococcales archaeon]
MGKALYSYILIALMIISPILPINFAGASGSYSQSLQFQLQQALQNASPETQQCINCHIQYTPGIVYDWLKSEHSKHIPADVLGIYEAIGYDNVTLADKFQGYNYTVGCYECHGMFKEANRPDVANHFGFQITTIVTLKDCSQCHMKEAQEITWTMHGFASLNAPLKPWYSKIVSYAKDNNLTDEMLPPVYNKTGIGLVDWPWYMQYATKLLNNPNDPEVQQFGTIYDMDFKNIVSPLYPASGVLNNTVMHNESFKNAYVYFACMQCHGSLVVPYDTSGFNVKYWGWPSNGAGRVDPDGSIGTCTACHTRHSFSLEEVRKPYTCGQCHLGYDHPHIEIYEESKHGNIYDAEGESWNWSALPWKVGVDFRAPTCAVCHMSTLADPNGTIKVPGTHDLRARLVWDQMHFFSYPKPKWPDHTQNAIIKGASQLTGSGLLQNGVAFEGYQVNVGNAPQPGQFGFPRLAPVTYTDELAQHRNAMKSVCELCHSSQWTDNYFMVYDQVIVDYNVTAHYAFSLLQQAWSEGIQNNSNKIDEYMEIMWYYIWHHDGRRWRNGAAMMGPDFTHWFGIVDTVMDKLGRMIVYYNTAVQIKELQQEIQQLQQSGGSQANITQLQAQLQQLESRLAAMEAQVPTLVQQINATQAQLETLGELPDQVASLNNTVNSLSSTVNNLQGTVNQLQQDVNLAQQKADSASSTAQEAKSAAGKVGTATAI